MYQISYRIFVKQELWFLLGGIYMQMEEPLNIERDVVKNGVRLDCVFEGYY